MNDPKLKRNIGVCHKLSKEHRCKKTPAATPKGRPRRRKGEQVDLQALLVEPVSVVKAGKAHKMDPFEAMLRRQLELALKERSIGAIKMILEQAIESDLLRKPPAGENGGVLRVPMITEADIALVRSWQGKSSTGSGDRQE